MATRRKTTTTVNEPQHICSQEKCLGEINARLDGQEKTDERIEQAILGLVAQTVEERKNTADSFEKVHVELAKMSTVLENTSKTAAQQVENQTEMIKQLTNLSNHTESIKKQQDEFKKHIDKHIQESDAWKKDIDERVSKLERFKYVWYLVGAGILVILTGAAYFVSVWDFVEKHIPTQTEQVAPSNNK
jgi:hypothetical protein